MSKKKKRNNNSQITNNGSVTSSEDISTTVDMTADTLDLSKTIDEVNKILDRDAASETEAEIQDEKIEDASFNQETIETAKEVNETVNNADEAVSDNQEFISENHLDDSEETEEYTDSSAEYNQDEKPYQVHDSAYFAEHEEQNSIDNFEDQSVYNISETSNDDAEESYGSFAKKEKKSKKKKANKDSGKEETFGAFAKEFGGHVKDKVNRNKKIVIIVSSVAIAAVVIIIAVLLIPKGGNHNIASQNTISDSQVSVNSLEVPTDNYETDAYPEVNALISQYYLARQSNDIETLRRIQKNVDDVEAAKYEVLGNHIDEYVLKNCYTKKGPFVNSYIVYATFDVKLKDYDVLAPGLQTFIVCSEDDGTLYIYSGDFEPDVASYISSVSAQDDVKELMNRVSVEYNDVLASNEAFGQYMNSFKAQIKTEIGEKIAASEVSSGGTAGGSQSVSTGTETSGTESFSVKTTDNVNIRKSDSENADKIATISAGTTLLCTNQKANGWSEVIYNGETGYIKSEFLVKPGEDGGADIETNGTLMINETIKIRKEPSTEAGYYGVGYAGQTFEKIETLDNGWTKILFEGKEAYIKSDYIVQ